MLDFLFQFAPLEFVLGELGVRLPQEEATSPSYGVPGEVSGQRLYFSD